MRFIADAMLGTLAKWLRLLGYDTVFDSALDDHQLVRMARAEDRILLTRDRALSRRPGLSVLLIASEQLDEQISQVVAEFALVPDRRFSRCPVCNQALASLDREQARERVPAYVARTQDEFRTCSVCQRVYWRGTHWQQMGERLARLGLATTLLLADGPADNERTNDIHT